MAHPDWLTMVGPPPEDSDSWQSCQVGLLPTAFLSCISSSLANYLNGWLPEGSSNKAARKISRSFSLPNNTKGVDNQHNMSDDPYTISVERKAMYSIRFILFFCKSKLYKYNIKKVKPFILRKVGVHTYELDVVWVLHL